MTEPAWTARRIAVVNRGDAAMRALNALRDLELEEQLSLVTIALYVEGEQDAPFVRRADEHYCLGPATATDPTTGRVTNAYTQLPLLRRALTDVRADAAWVGWGFVSESAEFARLCEECGVQFLGPSAAALELLGDKGRAKSLAESVGVPVTPWSGGPVTPGEDAAAAAARLGFPLLVKATAGGGGRGIRRVDAAEDLEVALASASAEAGAAFGDRSVILESLVSRPRHLEVQVVADLHGHVAALGVRDCTVQRRRQKVVEEAGDTVVDDELRARLEGSAVQLVRAAGFTSLATVEFLLDQDNGAYYFMEVNPRLQVEHPVTESVTGIDLVRLQLDIAAGRTVGVDRVATRGHAIEARLSAEDPAEGFTPTPGRLLRLQLPAGPGVRVDTGLEEGSTIPVAFDSLICKVVASGSDRAQARARLRRALLETEIVVEGGTTNLGFVQGVLEEPAFVDGDVDTTWLDHRTAVDEAGREVSAAVAVLAGAVELASNQLRGQRAHLLRTASQGRPELVDAGTRSLSFAWRGVPCEADVRWLAPDQFDVRFGEDVVRLGIEERDPRRRIIRLERGEHVVTVSRAGASIQVDVDGWTHRITSGRGGPLRAPTSGVVVAVRARPGDHVEAGQVIAVLESMKLEVAVRSEIAGTLREVLALPNTQLIAGEPLAVIEPDDDIVSPGQSAGGVSLAPLGQVAPRRSPLIDEIGRALAGFDPVDGWREAAVSSLQGATEAQWSAPGASRAEVLLQEVDLFRAFADVAAVTRRTRRAVANESVRASGAQAMLHAFMRRPESGTESLPAEFIELLRRCLGRFGAHDLESDDRLWPALTRLMRAAGALDDVAAVLVVVAQRWIACGRGGEAAELMGELLGRFTQDPDGRFPAVAHALAAVEHQADAVAGDSVRWAEDGDLLIPEAFKRDTELWRLELFDQRIVALTPDMVLLELSARDYPDDRRLVAWGTVGRPEGSTADETETAVELQVNRAMRLMRTAMVRSFDPLPDLSNRVVIYVRDEWDPTDADLARLAPRLADAGRGLSLDKILLRIRRPGAPGEPAVERLVHLAAPGARAARLGETPPAAGPMRPLTPERARRLRLARRGLHDPYEVVDLLTSPHTRVAPFAPGRFEEHDLDDKGRLVPVRREANQNTAGVVVGVITNQTVEHPEGMRRVSILSDPSKGLGALAEPECRRILAALNLADELGVPVEWFAVSAGARVSMSAGTESLDWVARVLRRIVELTDRGHEINIVVAGVTVGAQPYFQAEATMLMHTRGILVMIQGSSMVLTGKDALDFAGAVSAEDNPGIGGFERVMGGNGEAQYWAQDLEMACEILFRHYAHTYVAPGEPGPRSRATTDDVTRDVREAVHGGDTEFATVGEIFDDTRNPGRRKPFHMRRVMDAVLDQECAPLERWSAMTGAEGVIVVDAHLGGHPVCLIGVESHTLPRWGPVAADGPRHWTGATLFPRSSKKMARAINAASGNRPVVILASLAGFDGSPESMRELQLEYGAEIARAVTRFRGPLIFCIVSRNHGGAFVVFSKQLNESIQSLAVRGAEASVIGGSAAAAVVFAREVEQRAMADPRVVRARQTWAEGATSVGGPDESELARVVAEARADARTALAREFDATHTVERALRVGSVDRIVEPEQLRPELIHAIRRGLSRYPPRACRNQLADGKAEPA